MKKPSRRTRQRIWSILCVAALSLSFWAGYLTVIYWDDLWYGQDFYHSASYHRAAKDYVDAARSIGRLLSQQQATGSLTYLQSEQLKSLQRSLDPKGTNFRCQIHYQSGELLWSNLGGDALAGVAGGVSTIADYQVFSYQFWDSLLTESRDVTLVIEYGALDPLVYEDAFWGNYGSYQLLQRQLPVIALCAVVLCTLTIWLVTRLWRAVRRRWEETPQVFSWMEQIPFDLFVLIALVFFALLFGAGDVVARRFYEDFSFLPAVGIIFLTVVIAALAVAFFTTLAARWRRLPIWKNTLLRRGWAALRQAMDRAVASWPVTRHPVLLFLLYLLGTLLTSLTVVLIPFYQGLALFFICRWCRQWRAVHAYAAQLLTPEDRGAPPQADHFFRDLREHVGQLGDLGRAVDEAVDQKTRAQRFQAELITNVSHDLKSPLTSIVNYVDILKKTPPDDPAVPGYLDVLDRKSQQLKKLTEDLIEASKASSGALAVNAVPLGLVEMAEQALGEYREKFTQSDLEPVLTLPKTEVTVLADGRHLWRALDNLFSNCVKYSLPGTRVYVEVLSQEDWGVVAVKNVSAQPLNLPPQELLGRFVRGDASRGTEGAGLGLSIAQNLAELQGGSLDLSIDGDLFKAALRLPLCPTKEASP